MQWFRPWMSPDPEEHDANRQTASLAGVVVILLLLVCGLFLFQTLRTKAMIEDCLMAGGRNCDSLAAGNR